MFVIKLSKLTLTFLYYSLKLQKFSVSFYSPPPWVGCHSVLVWYCRILFCLSGITAPILCDRRVVNTDISIYSGLSSGWYQLGNLCWLILKDSPKDYWFSKLCGFSLKDTESDHICIYVYWDWEDDTVIKILSGTQGSGVKILGHINL